MANTLFQADNLTLLRDRSYNVLFRPGSDLALNASGIKTFAGHLHDVQVYVQESSKN